MFGALLVWLAIVVVTMLLVAYLSLRWGHDPFGWLLLSAAMGPIALVALVATRQAGLARTAAPPRPHGLRTGRQPRVLAAVDGSAATRIARYIIDTYGRRTEVEVLAVLPHEARPDTSAQARLDHRELMERMTGETIAALRAGGVRARPAVAYGQAGEEIVRWAEQAAPDVIVVGRRGAGLSRTLLGSVSDHVAKHAPCPVTVVD